MRFFGTLLFSFVLCFGSLSFAQETRGRIDVDEHENQTKSGDIGIGAMLGDPIVVNGKYWLDEANAIDAGVAFDNDDLGIVADYLYHFRGALAGRGEIASQISPYLGGGLVVSFDQEGGDGLLDGDPIEDDAVGLGVRIPLGAEWLAQAFPASVFAELAPGLGIVDEDTFVFLQVGAGARFYF